MYMIFIYILSDIIFESIKAQALSIPSGKRQHLTFFASIYKKKGFPFCFNKYVNDSLAYI